MVIVPPYCGVPSESHQFPAALVVVGVVVATAVVVGVVALGIVVVAVVEVLAVVDVVVVGVDVVVDELQDASNIVVTSKTLKPNQINFVFNLFLHFK
jgi:hypothetical protein